MLSLQVLPAVNLGDVYQEIQPDPAAAAGEAFVAANCVTFRPPSALALLPLADGLPSIEYEVEAACKPISDSKLSLLFVGGKARLAGAPIDLPALGGTLPAPVIDALQGLLGERLMTSGGF